MSSTVAAATKSPSTTSTPLPTHHSFTGTSLLMPILTTLSVIYTVSTRTEAAPFAVIDTTTLLLLHHQWRLLQWCQKKRRYTRK